MSFEHLKKARLGLLIGFLAAQLGWFALPAHAVAAEKAYNDDRFSGADPCGPNPDRGR